MRSCKGHGTGREALWYAHELWPSGALVGALGVCPLASLAKAIWVMSRTTLRYVLLVLNRPFFDQKIYPSGLLCSPNLEIKILDSNLCSDS